MRLRQLAAEFFTGSDGISCVTLTITNSTISGNTSATGGGVASYCPNFGPVTITNSTISNNSANVNSGGGIFNQSYVTLINSIVANSTTGGDIVNVGGTTDAQYSLVEDGLGINGTSSNNLSGDPLLGSLTNNGGATETHALLISSPAIDKGSAVAGLTTDQRGLTRIKDFPSVANAAAGNGSDVGAFEVQCSVITVTNPVNTTGTINVAFSETFTSSGGVPAVTFTTTSTLPSGLTLSSGGVLSGTPTQYGNFPIVVTATDANGCTGISATYNLVINCITNPIVTNSNNSGPGSLRQAVIDACPNSIITFDMTTVTSPISLSDGQIILNKNLTIQGPGANLLTVQNTAAASNTSRVFLVNSGVTASISGLTISGGNLSLSEGGGIKSEGILTVTNSTFSGNSTGIVGNGGAIFSDGTLTVSNSTFINNSASSDGGAIYGNGGTLSDCTFSGNSTPGGFGGAVYAAAGTWSITRSTFKNNSAAGAGGAIYNANLVATITNCTFTNNSSANAGGGVANVGFQLTVINCSFYGNTVSNPGRGGALFTTIDGPLTLRNSIIAGSTNGNFNAGTGGITGVPVIDGGGNLKDDNTGPATITQVTLAQLALSPIANNGGPTQTIALGTGSVAINAGNNVNAAGLTTDQRSTGFPRISPVGGTVDVGAYENSCINNPIVINNNNSGPRQPAPGSN